MKDRVDWLVIKENRPVITISETSLHFNGFKRELTQNSDEYNLANWAVNLFDVLDLNIYCF